jgi:aldehyde:ferredoxin oxidoreductase
MCFKDWRTIFNNMFLCKFPKPAWTNFKIEGKYRAGGGDKPEKLVQHAQYIVRIACKDPSKASSLSIVLKQVDGRVFKN